MSDSENGSGFGRVAALARRERFLICLLLATFFGRVLWAAVIPNFQTPDEMAHFAYIQDLGETFSLRPNDEMPVNIGAVGHLSTSGALPFHPESTQIFQPGSLDGYSEAEVKELPRALRTERNPGEASPARYYPPGYYLLGSFVYRIVAGLDTLTILFTLRVFSALLSTFTLMFSFLALRHFFRDEKIAQAASLIIALSPMYIFMGMAVNPDVLVWLVFSVLLYLMTRSLDEGLSFRANLAIAVTIGVGLWTKQTSLVALPFYLILLGFLYLKGNLSIRDAARYCGVTLFVLVAMNGWLYVGGLIRTSPDYPGGIPVSQPRSIAGFIDHFDTYWPEYRWTFDTFWGNYGWLDTPLSTDLYEVIRMGAAVAAVGLAAHILTSVYRRATDIKAIFYLSLSVTFVAAFILLNYLRITSGEGWLLQGRYFFPMIVPIIALLLQGILWYVPQPNRRRVLLVLLVAGMLWFQTDALFSYVIPRYYL